MNRKVITELLLAPYTSILRRFIPIRLKARARSFFYYGRNVYCPFCNRSFRHFLPVGVIPRPNSQCPVCGSVERYRLLYLYLKNKTAFFSKKHLKVLDIGPDRCFSKLCSSLPNVQYVSIDLFPKIARIKMDIKNLAFENETFDCIICFHVLEHVKDDLSAMREMFRVLRPTGWALVQVPVDINRAATFEDFNLSEKNYETVYGQSGHVRIYGLDFKHRLESAGFFVRVDRFIDELDNETVSKYALKHSYKIKFYETCDDLYYCSKH